MATKSKAGGYDCEFLSPPPKSLECSICLLTLREPHVISCCGNHYCKPCIARVQEANKPCPLCNDPDYSIMLHKGVMRTVNGLPVYCPQKEVGCAWVGDLGKLECHLNLGSRDSGCGYVVIECTYQCGGEFMRKDLAKHESEDCSNLPAEKQFGMLARQLKEVIVEGKEARSLLEKKIEKVLSANCDLGARCASLEARNDDLESHNASLEEDVREIKAKVDTIESEKQTLKNRVAMLESLAQKVFIVETRQANEARRLDKMEESLAKSLGNIELQVAAVETRLTPSPPFFFTISNFHCYQKMDFHWDSQPFYTHPRGYKFHMTVYPHGTNRCKGSHLSVYASITRGEYDDELEWPFKGVICIDVYNCTTKRWDAKPEIEFEETDDIKFTGKPLNSQSNPGLGYPNWVLLDEVQALYCHNSVVRFRVTKVKVSSCVYMAFDE